MKNTKKYLTLSLAACIALNPILVKAEVNMGNKTNVSINESIEEVEQPDYIKYEGKITEINEKEKSFSIRVMDNEEDAYNGMVFYINDDTILLDDSTQDFITKDNLKKGMKVSGYYSKDTIMLMSMPPQLAPDIIIVREKEEPVFIHVSRFNEELVSTDNQLKITPSEDTIIINKSGEKVDKEEIANKDLIVFYTISTKSIPAQTTPEKIIVIEKEEEEREIEIKKLDRVAINKREISLDNPIYKNEKGIIMVPLRQIAETLGYEVIWNNETKTAELTKGAQWIAVTIGQDNYNFAKMLIKLSAAPELKGSKSFVPFDFLRDVLQVNVEITKEGMINIEN